MFAGDYVLDVCLSWLVRPGLGVQRIPARDSDGIALAYLIHYTLNLTFDVFEIQV